MNCEEKLNDLYIKINHPDFGLSAISNDLLFLKGSLSDLFLPLVDVKTGITPNQKLDRIIELLNNADSLGSDDKIVKILNFLGLE
jgi:hypothetical protein